MFTIIQQNFIQASTMSIMGEATKSAVQLKNFPLCACDVQCAFEGFLSVFKNENLDPDVVGAIRNNLQLLGFPF